MQLYLLRHGITEAQSPGLRDSARLLADAGILALRRVLKAAKDKSVNPDIILSSPYARALNTARIALEELGVPENPITCHSLRPESSPEALWAEVVEAPGESILVVSHEPLLSAAASWLLGETRITVSFSPGTLARIDFERRSARPRGVLKWTLAAPP